MGFVILDAQSNVVTHPALPIWQASGSDSSSAQSPAAPPVPATSTTTATAPAAPPAPAKAPPKPATDHLPPFKVLLHNDDENDQLYVVRSLVDIAHLPIHQAFEVMMEAHHKGLSLVKVTHREHAELLMEQLRSKGLIATIEQQ